MNTYYKASISNFLMQTDDEIFGKIVSNDEFDTTFLQKDAWKKQIKLLKDKLWNINGDIIFEYTIPRLGRRIDNVLIINGIIIILEFKVGTDIYNSDAEVQARNYALDLSYFHKESHNRKIIPILIATEAQNSDFSLKIFKKNVYDVIYSNGNNLDKIIKSIINFVPKQSNLNVDTWINSEYRPTPTIIEAAKELYNNHSVKEISQNESAENLTKTTDAVQRIINYSKNNHKKSICFITGVPGAGKTLAGLNIAIENQKTSGSDYACFLSGNYPLVRVLQKALAQNATKNYNNIANTSTVEDFIQIVHLFRDESLTNIERPPTENIVIFDEAQRAWHNEKLADFLTKNKSKVLNKIPTNKLEKFLSMSESELFIEYMDRRKDWAVIVCLVGGGQDINDGEAGIEEWFNAIKKSFSDWDVYISDKITEKEYIGQNTLNSTLAGLKYHIENDLHLSVSLRSFRSEKVSNFIHALLDNKKEKAKDLYKEIKKVYPICMTRDLTSAKNWVKNRSNAGDKENCRYGIIASSKAKRLRADGLWVECKCTPEKWFLSDCNDIKSSYYMEEVATEFDVQGLEIDWAIVAWDADYRYENGDFNYYTSRGSNWNKINKEVDRRYLKNAYRVLLTRAREGFIIYVPIGNNDDNTRLCKHYDELWEYLSDIGIDIIENETLIELPKIKKIDFVPERKSVADKYSNNTNSVTKNDSQTCKIGETVRVKLSYLFNHNLLSAEEIENLKTPDYCNKIFNLGYPLLIHYGENGKDKYGRSRYWQKEIFGKKYKVCSQWYEDQRVDFDNWYEKIISKTLK